MMGHWQGLWKGVLPSLVMVSNPTVNYVLYEWLLARLADLRRKQVASEANPLLGIPCLRCHPLLEWVPTAGHSICIGTTACFA